MRVLNSQQMREADRRTVEEVGIPAIVLMENAGRQVVSAIEATFDNLASSRVAVLCGRGNNGGDGFVAARTLAERGVDVGIYLVGLASDVNGDAKTNLTICRNLGLDVVEISEGSAWELHRPQVLGADLIVDALFGTGLRSAISGVAEAIVADVNASSRPVVAVDLPSGLSADSEQLLGPAITAAMTITFGAPKLPLVLPPGELLTGKLVVAEMGIPRSVIAGLEGPWIDVLTRKAMGALVEPRSREAHKGDYGHVLVVAGSPGKTGAAHLAATAALRSGAGLVTAATPASSTPVLAGLGAEYMTLALDEASNGTAAADAIDQLLAFDADVIALGPGLGRSPSIAVLVRALVERSAVPLILDADALNVFEGHADLLAARDDVSLIITPHPGEMARLTGLSTSAVQANRVEVAREFATRHRLHVVLKGHRTIVASPDGKTSINTTGNPGMATGGSGDVLLGVIAAWLGQLRDPDAATRLGTYVHGLAGDLAAADQGEVGLVAGDIVGRLGDAVRHLTATGTDEDVDE